MVLVESVQEAQRVVADRLLDLIGERFEEGVADSGLFQGLVEVADLGDIEKLGDAGVEARRQLASRE